MARWIAATGLEDILTGLVGYLEHDYLRWPRFDKQPRVANHSPIGVIELMPISNAELYGFKYVNGHPSNPARGFPTVVAFGVLADVDNGCPVLVAEMTLLTALRTAAMSALAARTLARPDSTVMALIGAGSQAEFQALAIRSTTGIGALRVFDLDPGAVAKLVRNLAPLGFSITVAASVAEAVAGADIITTCTADKSDGRILADGDVRPGVHLNAIGGDCPGKTELDPAILDRAEVFVEFAPQTRIEGEIQSRDAAFPITEFWEVVCGQAPGRTGADAITLFDSVGFAIEDFSALRFVHDRVTGSDYVETIDLIAEPDDPKDLFGLVGALSPVE